MLTPKNSREFKHEIIDKFKELKSQIDKANVYLKDFSNIHNLTNLYINKYLPGSRYSEKIADIDDSPEEKQDFTRSIAQLSGLLGAIIEDLYLQDDNRILIDNTEFIDLNNARSQIQEQLAKVEAEKEVLLKLREINNKKEESLIEESKKFDEFKQKRELIENKIDFRIESYNNRNFANAILFLIIISIGFFVTYLIYSISNSNDLFCIALDINNNSKGMNKELVNNIIYIELAKKLATKGFVYSLIVYLITFLVKNYNAQMHNYVVNSHKSNTFNSALSLIGTANSDEGNDKIITQATQAIFTSQRSGYQGIENEPTSPNLITNVIDEVQKK